MSSEKETPQGIGRRQLLRLAGGSTVLAVGYGLTKNVLKPFSSSAVDAAAIDPHMAQITKDHYMFLGGTDGWIGLPASPAIPPFHPDVLAEGLGYQGSDLTTYIFGFRNITELDGPVRSAQKMHAQHSAPLFWVDQFTGTANSHSSEFVVDITNLGLAQRPDLFDAHTLHWHGFRNVIPFFDGEPTGSVSVPAGTVFRYVYRPLDPGTYMYHCHVEDVEHVHMGMNGMVFVRPAQNGTSKTWKGKPYKKFLYNDGDGLTGHDREYSLHLSEIWAEAHWADAHIQLPEWSDYHPDFSLLNGRVYPDTVAPNAPYPTGWGKGAAGTVVVTQAGVVPDPQHVGQFLAVGTPWTKPYMPVKTLDDGTLAPIDDDTKWHLQYQPLSSLIECIAGERVAIRFSNLGFKEAAITIDGIDMHVVGRDATLMRGKDGVTDTSYVTNTINFSAGESFDVIITAPPFATVRPSSDPGYDTYLLYNRAFKRTDNLAGDLHGGQATEVRVYPNTQASQTLLPTQTVPNTGSQA
jgi:hypothetical protein